MPLVLSGTNGISSDGANWAIQPQSGGRITYPNQPMFYGDRIGFSSVTADGVVVPWRAVIDVGSNYNSSTNRWTVPVAGKYLVIWTNLYRTTSGYVNSGIYINGGNVAYMYTELGWTNNSLSVIVSAAAGDYITIQKQAGTGEIHPAQYATLVILKVG